MVSIIISYHNEGLQFIQETVDSIKSTIDIDYEIIIVDDFSDEPLSMEGVKVIRHSKNKGVGAAFDSGVKEASSCNIFLMGSDVRFAENKWASLLQKEIEDNTRSLICSSVLPLSFEYPDITFAVAKKFLQYDMYRGASIKWLIGDDNSPHHIIEAQWMPREFLRLRRPNYIPSTRSYPIPCVLGAVYGVSKDWYNYIDGFWGHKFWGTLEPLISLKSWLFGGSCLVAPHIETAHIFKSGGNHASVFDYGKFKNYNRMLVCYLLLPDDARNLLIKWLKENEYLTAAKEIVEENMEAILAKRDEYSKKMVLKYIDLVNDFNLMEIKSCANKTAIQSIATGL